MATWRCPNCGTLQRDAAQCFLCQRSATSCGTCVNFRRSVVGGVGYCGLDRLREPLSGAERRPCWTGASAADAAGLFADAAHGMPPSHSAPLPEPRRRSRLIALEPPSQAAGS
jgi:hypothetical protein